MRLPVDHWIECDAYDRATFGRLGADSPSLRRLLESGANLLPHFDGFALDLFSMLFKMNVVIYDRTVVLPSIGFCRVVLEEILKEPALEVLRDQTVLDQKKAGLAAVLLGDRLLELIKSERILTRGEMLDYWNLERQQSDARARQEELATAEELAERASGAGKRQIEVTRDRMRRELETAERQMRQMEERVRRRSEEGTAPHRERLRQQAARVRSDLAETVEEAESWSHRLGGGGQISAGRHIEIGKQLASNPKLRRVSQMVGRMREQALALRKKMYERANDEAFEVQIGRALSRLLPSELATLRHPLLRRDFARRFVEGDLLQYALRGVDQRGRGPMIICLDGSSSMAGEKEIWSKAVTLTLLDIARRQRRRFRSICFSSADTPLQELDLNRREAYETDMDQVFALAEYFPGGGTDFQKPLQAALACLRRTSYRLGDIVLITDGECRVEAPWLLQFKAEKERLRFSVFSILVDVGSSSLATVREFSDKVTTVSQLTDEGAREIFLTV